MNKNDIIIDYFNGISLYTLMHDVIENNDILDFSNISDEVLVYAKSALIANFFLLKKEQMIETGARLTYKSRIIDEELEKTVATIATKVGDEYQIGHFIADAPTIIATIRNKFAHGDYYVDAKNNKIIINKDNAPIGIDVDKLTFCIASAIINFIGYPKTPAINRKIVVSIGPKVFNNQPIKNEYELIEHLKYCKIIEMNLRTIDGTNLNADQLGAFLKLTRAYAVCADDKATFNILRNKFEILAAKDNLVYNQTKSKIQKVDTPSRLVKYLSDFPEFYLGDLASQIYVINSNLLKLEYPNYDAESYMYSNFVHLRILQEITKKRKMTREELLSKFKEGQLHLIDSNMASMFIINEISRFNILYFYPLEHIFCEGKYNIERSNEFDFSKLDLNFINPDILKIDDNPLRQITNKLNSSNKRLVKYKIAYDKELLDYEQTKNTISDKANIIRTTNIENKKNNYIIELEKNRLLNEQYNLITEDYTKNSLYFKNRAIIEGIRNSIAHGNVKIEDLNSSIPANNLITFTNNFNGKVCFKLTISLSDFQQIFNEQNVIAIGKFLTKKDKNKIKMTDKIKIFVNNLKNKT